MSSIGREQAVEAICYIDGRLSNLRGQLRRARGVGDAEGAAIAYADMQATLDERRAVMRIRDEALSDVSAAPVR